MKQQVAMRVLLAVAAVVPARCRAQQQDLRLLDVGPATQAPEALRSVPLSPGLRADFERALGAHDYARAETILVNEIDRCPKPFALLTLAASIFFLDGKYLNSAIALKKAEALAPLDDRSRFTLAMAYVKLNHRDWARPELEKLWASNPRNALYPYWLSRLDYDAMRFASAIAEAQQALQLDPSLMKAYDNLGLCYEAIGRYDRAIEAYRNAIRLNRAQRPCSPWPPCDLGALLVKLGRLDEAALSLQESLDCDPRFSRAHYQRGLLLEKQGKLGEAAAELEQAASLEPNYAETYYVLGRVYRREGDPQKSTAALATFEKLKKAESHVRPH